MQKLELGSFVQSTFEGLWSLERTATVATQGVPRQVEIRCAHPVPSGPGGGGQGHQTGSGSSEEGVLACTRADIGYSVWEPGAAAWVRPPSA